MIDLLEHTVKGGGRGKTGLKGYLGDGKGRIQKKQLRVAEPQAGKIIPKGDSHNPFKKSGKVKFAEACYGGSLS